MRICWRALALVLALSSLAACGRLHEPGEPSSDGGPGHADGGSIPDGDAGLDGGADAGGQGGADAGIDACPVPSGFRWNGVKRFMFGTNWAWRSWTNDFGGGAGGVSQREADFSSGIEAMKTAGVSVIRWWMFQQLRVSGGGIEWADGAPSGITSGVIADVFKALELAEQRGVYLMLTPFSFDNFDDPADPNYAHNLEPMVVDPTLRQKLLDNLIRPLAQAVEDSPYKHRLIAWDVINEPEWAIAGSSLNGDPDFEPTTDRQVSHQQMLTFINEVAATLKQHSSAPVTVGGAAIKWGRAWKGAQIDFYQLHYYDWVHQWFPYTTHTLEAYGLTDKPVVMGEFPMRGVSAVGSAPARDQQQLVTELYQRGYAGALSWAYNSSGNLAWDASQVAGFPNALPCESSF